LGPRDIREYQAELFQKRKLSPGTVGIRLAALRFFYIKTLKKSWSIAETPYPKKTRRLPTILSQEEVTQLIHAARTQRERILLMTLYPTGARNAELTHLKATDIDSQRMVVHIRGGKGRTDRSRISAWLPAGNRTSCRAELGVNNPTCKSARASGPSFSTNASRRQTNSYAAPATRRLRLA
jgi:site-specific recombinase XerC